jgi:beta-glucosidase
MIRYAVPILALGTVFGGLQVAPAIASSATGSPPGSGKPVPANCPWMNTRESATQRANQLLAASTLNQKLRWLNEQAANTPAQTTFGTVTYPVQVACTPTVVYTDGPDYNRGTTGATVYPAQIALASTFSTSLAYEKGKSQADEAFRSRKNVILGPGVSSSRTPLAGRTPEYLGEDSLLSGDLAAANINGIQKGNPSEPVMAVLKHYVANEQELDRQTSSSNVDGRTLREVYNMPFQIALSKGEPGGVMCSYNQINGVYGCENPVLKNLLKGADNFSGYVVSDFGAVHTTAASLNAGLDQELNAPRFYNPTNINAAIDSGAITVADVDAAAFRVVKSYIQAGLFDHPLPATATTTPSTDATKAVAEQVAEKGSVLLKNTGGILPLSKSSGSVAIIGPTASNTPTNGVSAATVCAEGSPASPFPSGPACTNPVAPLDAITARAAKFGATVTFNDGSDLTAAAAAAAAAKTVIVFGYAKQGEFADRTTLALDNNGDALIAAVAAANPNTIVVLETGTATTMPWLAQVKGVVEAWYPGDQQGNALARLLYGDANFSGRLPMTFPKSLADIPTSTPAQYPGLLSNGTTTRATGDTSIRQVSYSEGLAIGYKWYQSKKIEPLFPFGFGLSYTGFDYSRLQVSSTGQSTRKVAVSFVLKNTGSTTGTETPQVYLTLPSSTGEPGSRLVSFSQVTLRAGESQRVTAVIDPASSDKPLSYWDTTAHAWATAPGSYSVAVGGSASATLSAAFTITK